MSCSYIGEGVIPSVPLRIINIFNKYGTWIPRYLLFTNNKTVSTQSAPIKIKAGENEVI